MDNATNLQASEKRPEKLEITYDPLSFINCIPRLSLLGAEEISAAVTTIQDELPLAVLRQRAMKSVLNNLLTYLKDENKEQGKTNIEKTLAVLPPPFRKEILNQRHFKSIHKGQGKRVTSLETLLNIAERYRRVDVLAVLIKNGADRAIQPKDTINTSEYGRMILDIDNRTRDIPYNQICQNENRLISNMSSLPSVLTPLISSRISEISSRIHEAHYYPAGPIIVDQNGKAWV